MRLMGWYLIHSTWPCLWGSRLCFEVGPAVPPTCKGIIERLMMGFRVWLTGCPIEWGALGTMSWAFSRAAGLSEEASFHPDK